MIAHLEVKPESAWEKWLWRAALSLVAFVGLFVLSQVFLHLYFDFPLNQYEAEQAIESHEISQGRIIYYDVETGPFSGLYAPGFQLLGALFYLFFPDSLVTLRWISFLSMIGIVLLSFGFNRRKPTLKVFLLTGLSIFVWHNALVQFDLHGKSDSLAAFLGWLGLFLFTASKSNFRNPLLYGSAMIFAIAVSVKQPTLAFLVAVLITMIIYKHYKAMVVMLGAFLLISLVWWDFLETMTGPSLYFNAFVVPGQYAIRWNVFFDSIYNSILFQPFVWLTLLLFGLRAKYKVWDSFDSLFFITLVLTAGASTLTAAKAGGMANAYSPFFWGISLYLLKNDRSQVLFDLLSLAQLRLAFVAALSLAVFVTAHINPASAILQWPRLFQSNQIYQEWTNDIRQVRGQVFVPMDNYLTLKAGKPLFYSQKSEIDVRAYPFTDKKPAFKTDSIALTSEVVITHDYQNWHKSTALRQLLAQNGFEAKKEVQFDQQLTLRWWQRRDTNGIESGKAYDKTP